MRASSLLLLLALVACGSGSRTTDPPDVSESLSASEHETLKTTTIFFGHQSVGRNLLAGMAGVLPELRVVRGVDGANVEGPVLIESALGHNGDPRSKDQAFLDAVALLPPGSVALYKYCYADMVADTNPDSLHACYTRTLQRAADQGVRVVAVTMPLTTVAPAWKYWLKQLSGRIPDRELNLRRERFNQRLRESSLPWPLVDLAQFEATAPDGRLCTVSYHGAAVPVLASEYTSDGSHLDARGQRRVAPRFFRSLARAIEG